MNFRFARAIPVAAAAIAAPAHADSVTWTGDVVEGNSWSAGFLAFSFASVDFMGVRVTSATGALEGPVFFNFSSPGWANHADYGEFPTIAAASGPDFNSMAFRLRFAGDIPDPIAYDLVFFDGEAVASVFHFNWDGANFDIDFGGTQYGMTRGDFASGGTFLIPLPPAAGLTAAGLLVLGAGRRRPGT